MKAQAMKTQAKNAKQDHQLAIRVSGELMDAIDREVERLNAERPGARVQRSDAIREILHRALLMDDRSARRR